MAGIFFVACLLATWAADAYGARYQYQLQAELDSPSPSPSVSTECSTLIYNMASCLPILSDGGNEMKPDSACCSGFESVVKENAECICEALRSSSDLGVKLNISKAMALPSACDVSATPINECDVNPPVSPTPSGGESTAAPSTDTGNHSLAPSSVHGGAYSTSASLTVIISMLLASFSINISV